MAEKVISGINSVYRLSLREVGGRIGGILVLSPGFAQPWRLFDAKQIQLKISIFEETTSNVIVEEKALKDRRR